MSETTWFERILAHNRVFVIATLISVIVASWLYLLNGAGTGMSTVRMTSWKMALGISVPMSTPMQWNVHYAWLMFVMWWFMMVAMMLPSAAPMILLHARVSRKASERSGPKFSNWTIALFAIGYLAAWAVFSVVATTLQWTFESLGVLSATMMNSTNLAFAGLILTFAGLYQLTPLKQACLRHCRSPIGFLSRSWRPGFRGAFEMGARHGLYCLGCCWGLMAILFFGGIMNLYWIIGLAMLVLLEKILPVGPTLSIITGSMLTIWGASILASLAT